MYILVELEASGSGQRVWQITSLTFEHNQRMEKFKLPVQPAGYEAAFCEAFHPRLQDVYILCIYEKS